MSLRRVDPRFCLPRIPRTASVLGGLADWKAGLTEVGVEVRDPSHSPPDLVVAPSRLASAAAATGAEMVIVEGHGAARPLLRAGYAVRRYLTRPRIERPDFLVPLEEPPVAAYAVEQWSASYTRLKQVRNTVAKGLLLRRAFPEIGPVTTVGVREAGPPYVLAAAAGLGVPRDARWFLTLGQVRSLSRNAFHVFPPGAAQPEWVLKFSRLPRYEEPFRREQEALAVASRTPAAAQRAPTPLGRFQVDGVHASLETAAVGTKLLAVLLGPASEQTKLRLVDAVVSWVLELAAETAAPPETLEPERRRLLAEIVPAWAEHGARPDLVTGLPAVPAILQHGDLGPWNVVIGPAGFTVVDWETVRRHGFPLWDLAYFLTDALSRLDGADAPADQDVYARRLLRGELPRSELFFRRLREAARASRVPDEAVPALVALGWLHYGRAPGARRGDPARASAGFLRLPGLAARLAEIWLADPALFPTWQAWHER